MSFEDFARHFTHLDLVHIGPDDWMSEPALHSKQPWRAVLARRRWRSGYNAGGGPTYTGKQSSTPTLAPRSIKRLYRVEVFLTFHTSCSVGSRQDKSAPSRQLLQVSESSSPVRVEYQRRLVAFVWDLFLLPLYSYVFLFT
jgi:hypothetical protein